MVKTDRTNSSRILKKQLYEFTLKLKDKKNLRFLQNSVTIVSYKGKAQFHRSWQKIRKLKDQYILQTEK